MRISNIPAVVGNERPAHLLLAFAAGLLLLSPLLVFETTYEIPGYLWLLITEGRCPRYESMSDCVRLHEDIWASLRRILPGIGAAIVGIILALFGSLSPAINRLLGWVVIVLFVVPSTVVYIILIFHLGVGEQSKIWGMISVGLTTDLLLSVYAVRGFLHGKGSDVAQWKPIYRQLQMDGVRNVRLVWEHMIPLLAPRFFWSLILVTGVSWKFLIIIEAVGTTGAGLGYMMWEATGMVPDEGILQLWAAIVVAAFCSGSMIGMIHWLERLHERRVFRCRVLKTGAGRKAVEQLRREG